MILPSELKIEAKESVNIPLLYQPLVIEDTSGALDIVCDGLEPWKYLLTLIGTQPFPKQTVSFHADLGESPAQTIRLPNVFNKKTRLLCRLCGADASSFICSSSVETEESDFNIPIIYEPVDLQKIHKATLWIEYMKDGAYEVPLVGHCSFPKPKGPIQIQRSTTIPFKNVFLQDMTFDYRVDNNFFKLKTLGKIVSKQTSQIGIEVLKASKMERGMLTISSESEIRWIFYLQFIP